MMVSSSVADPAALATVAGVALHGPAESLSAPELRQRACTELLRQAAMRDGLLDAADPVPTEGAISEAAAQAIEAWLEREIQVPEPAEEACRRHHAANAARYAVGERVLLRHVLFAVTPGVDLNALRQRAEACLIDLRAPIVSKSKPGVTVVDEVDRFAEVARSSSNCPSGAEGGALGWLERGDCAPEIASEVFGRSEVGVLPRLVHSRFGLHVVEVLARESGSQPAYETVQAAVAQSLRQLGYATALRQRLQRLAAEFEVEGVDLDRADSPLLQ